MHKDVDTGESKSVSYPNSVGTFGVGTCVGIGIVNMSMRKGYVGHYISRDDLLPLRLVDRAIREAEKRSDLEIAVVGNVPLSRQDAEALEVQFERELERTKAYSKWLLETMKGRGIDPKNIQNYLENNPAIKAYEVVVDTRKGVILVRRTL